MAVLKVLTKYYGFGIEQKSGSHYLLKRPRRQIVTLRHDRIKVGVMKSNYH